VKSRKEGKLYGRANLSIIPALEMGGGRAGVAVFANFPHEEEEINLNTRYNCGGGKTRMPEALLCILRDTTPTENCQQERLQVITQEVPALNDIKRSRGNTE